MAEPDAQPGGIKCLKDFFEDCRKLDLEPFTELHGEGFFLHRGPIGRLEPPGVLPQSTVASECRGTDPEPSFVPQEDFLVFPVRRADRSTDVGSLIFIGRNRDNDVPIPDVSVSGVHAIVTRAKTGQFYFLDFGSINGSSINGEAAPVQGVGELVEIESGARVRIGSVELTFLRAAEFRTLVNRLFS